MLKKNKTGKIQMRKLLKKNKPTEAKYFMSESQRKRTGRMSFIYGSPKIVAILTILVLGSAVTGTYIVQKSRGSQAATPVQRAGVSFSKTDAPVPVANWSPTNSSNNTALTTFSKANDELTVGFKAGGPGRFEYGNGYRACYNIVLGASQSNPNLLYHNVRFTYRTNEAGTNGMGVYLNGGQVGLLEDRKLNGNPNTPHEGGGLFDKTILADLGSATPGSTVSFCNVKIGGSTAYFTTDRNITVYAYTFGGSFDQSNTEVIGTVTDNFGKAVAGVQISNCQTYPAATTDSNGQYRFYVPPGSYFCIRLQSGITQFSRIEATNANKGAINVGRSADGSSYENQPANAIRLTSFDFRGILKETPAERKCTESGSSRPDLVEAENAHCVGTVIVADDGAASAGKAALLKNDKDYVDFTFTAPQDGKYQAVSRMRAQPGAPGKIYFEFKKLTSGASETEYESNKGVSASSSYTNYTPKKNDAPIAHSMTKGQKAIIRVQQIGSPDIVVDQLMMNYAGPLVAPPTPPTPPPAAQTFERCSNTGSGQIDYVEAEKALCSANVIVAADGAANGGKAALLDKDGETVEYVFTAPKEGRYSAVALMRSQTTASTINFEFKKLDINLDGPSVGKAQNNKAVSTGSSYTNYTIKKSDGSTDEHDMQAGQKAIIRIKQVGSPKVVVDRLSMNYAGPLAANTGSNTPVSTSPVGGTVPSTCNSESIVEAENAIRKGSTGVATDPLYQDRQAAVLFSGGAYVECTLRAPKDGTFTFGAQVRSQDWNGIAEATISMRGRNISSDRTLKAQPGQIYSLMRFNQKEDYKQLTKGQPVTVKVTFVVNDGSRAYSAPDKDRNLWVDKLMLVEIPDTVQSTTGGQTQGGGGDSESVVVPCDKGTRVEAENASLYKGAKAEFDSTASLNSMVRISNNTQYIECTLTVPDTGDYVLGATAKGQKRLGDNLVMQLSMAGGGRGVQTDTQDVGATYDRVRMRVNDQTRRSMSAQEKVVVRISSTNATSSALTKKSLLVDSIELIKVPPKATPPADINPIDRGNEPTTIPITPQKNGSGELSYDTSSGIVYIKAEAENSGYRGTAFDEQPAQLASGGKAVRLWSNKNFVEYTFDFPATDNYGLDFAARSENYKNKTAEARIILDGKQLFGNDISLISSAKHNYYTSERKVLVQKGFHTFRVEFTNDARGADGDRNLIIDFLRIRGSKRLSGATTTNPGTSGSPTVNIPLDPNTQYMEAEDATKCRSKEVKFDCGKLAITDNTAFGKRALRLDERLDFVEAEFIAPKTGKYSIGATAKSIDYRGSAKASIFIDGNKVAEGVTPSSQNFSPYYSYERNFNKGTRHHIRVQFINDLCGSGAEPCNKENDRNLLVDQFRLTLISASADQSGDTASAPVVSGPQCSANPNRKNVQWPTKPFSGAHVVRATFGGEPRGYVSAIPGQSITTSTVVNYLDSRLVAKPSAVKQRGIHHGIDVVALAGTPVYAIQSGVVSSNKYVTAETVRVGQFEYTHLLKTVPVGTQVEAFKTIIGYIDPQSEHFHLTYFVNADSRAPLNPLTHLNFPGYCDSNKPEFDSNWLLTRTPAREEYKKGTGGPIELFVNAYDLAGVTSPYNGGSAPKTGINRIWATVKENGKVVQSGIVRDFNNTLPDPSEGVWMFSPGSDRVRPDIAEGRVDYTRFEYRITRDKPLTMKPGSIYEISVTIEDPFGNRTQVTKQIEG